MPGHYFDRSGTDTLVALCDACGELRWGSEDGDPSKAFDNRYYDESGDWCWAPWLAGNVPCDNCGVVVR